MSLRGWNMRESSHALAEAVAPTGGNVGRIVGALLAALFTNYAWDHAAALPRYLLLGATIGILVTIVLQLRNRVAILTAIEILALVAVMVHIPAEALMANLLFGVIWALLCGVIADVCAAKLGGLIMKHRGALVAVSWVLCVIGSVIGLLTFLEWEGLVGECLAAGAMLGAGAFLYSARRPTSNTWTLYVIAGILAVMGIGMLARSLINAEPLYAGTELFGAGWVVAALLPFVIRGEPVA